MSVRDEAARFGIDLALLDANLALTPAERLSELTAMIRLAEELQARTLPAELQSRLQRAAMLAEVRAYGFEDDLARFDAEYPPVQL